MKKHFKIILAVFMLFFMTAMTVYGIQEPGIALAFALPIGFGPLKWACGSENMGGYKNRVLFIPACSVSEIPTLPAEVTESVDLVTAAGSFTFNELGDEPIFIYATDKTVTLTAENQGETDGQSFVQQVEFFHPGSKAEVAAFSRKVNNTPGYIILEDPNGDQYMVGSKGLPANIKPSFSGGTDRADRKGFAFTGEADSFSPFVILGTPIDMDELENPTTP